MGGRRFKAMSRHICFAMSKLVYAEIVTLNGRKWTLDFLLLFSKAHFAGVRLHARSWSAINSPSAPQEQKVAGCVCHLFVIPSRKWHSYLYPFSFTFGEVLRLAPIPTNHWMQGWLFLVGSLRARILLPCCGQQVPS